jgi:hypothetical protein
LLQTTTNLNDPGSWQPVKTLTGTNAPQSIDWTNGYEPARYFRALPQ